jgi:hypothetical protein
MKIRVRSEVSVHRSKSMPVGPIGAHILPQRQAQSPSGAAASICLRTKVIEADDSSG